MQKARSKLILPERRGDGGNREAEEKCRPRPPGFKSLFLSCVTTSR